ncbi:MAG: metallophosphoesterase [Firmicutes bacterium]|nr:metallophosphoesterase [Bacillota bacterium]
MVRIVQVSDLHIEAEPETMFPGVGRVLEEASEVIRALAPDLLVVTGDLTTFGSSRPRDLVLARQWLEQLDRPWVAIAGNHDLGSSPERALRHPETEAYEPLPLARTHFGTVFGPQPVSAVDLGAVEVVAFNLRAGDPDNTLPAIRQAVEQSAKPVILCGHYPLEPVRVGGPCSAEASQATGSFLPELATLVQPLVAQYDHIRLYLAGHVHVNSRLPLSPHCLQLTTGGLGPGASSLRVFTVAQGWVRYDTLLGPGPQGFWERVAPAMGPYPPAYHLGTSEEQGGEWRLEP